METLPETSKTTAWDELNGPQCKRSETLALYRQELELAQAKAMPCPLQTAMVLLGKNLTLCSPSGMNEADRIEWLKVALEAIGDVPQDLLEGACAKARRYCDHPAKIVPFICNETAEHTLWRQKNVRAAQAKVDNFDKPRLERKGFELPESERKEVAVGLGELLKEFEAKVTN